MNTVRILAPVSAAAVAILLGCSVEPDAGENNFGDSTSGGAVESGSSVGSQGEGEDDSTSGADAESGSQDLDPEPDEGPHARAIVVLGENQASTTTTPTPFITASFFPDYDGGEAVSCGAEIDGCFVASAPACDDLCEFGETCQFDDACRSVCQAPCDLTCSAGEQCYFPLPGVAGCRAIETFDAGALTFEGTAVPITLYPPYILPTGVSQSLSVPGAEVRVAASGAAAAGFEAFEATMFASDPILTDLETLTTGKAFGPDPMPLSWVPGDGDAAVRVTVQVTTASGSGGRVECVTTDSGSYSVPREAINIAIGSDEPSSMLVTVERRASTLTTGVMTKGALVDAEVQPVGVVELVSASSVSSSVAACPSGTSPCGVEDACISTEYDELNCGGCGIECGAGETCSLGECVTPGTCCEATATPGCAESPSIEQCVCDVYSPCCTSGWNSTCVSYISTYGCGVC